MTKNSSRSSIGDQEKIVAGIEQARQDLSDSVQALAAKIDVSARVKEKAGQARKQIGGTLGTLNRTARNKAPQVRDKVSASLGKAGQKIPEPARRSAERTTRQATDAARERPGAAYAAAAGVCAAAGLWLWRRKRRS